MMMMMHQNNNGYGRSGNCYTACSGGDNSSVDVVVNVTIEEPDDTSELMLHLEGESAPCSAAATAVLVCPVSYENHDLFYDHYEYDPLLYVAEYNQNNPINNDTRNDRMHNENENDTDTDTLLMRESEEELLQLCQGSFHHKNIMNTSLSSLEPISESENEEDDAEDDAEEEGIELVEEKEEEQ